MRHRHLAAVLTTALLTLTLGAGSAQAASNTLFSPIGGRLAFVVTRGSSVTVSDLTTHEVMGTARRASSGSTTWAVSRAGRRIGTVTGSSTKATVTDTQGNRVATVSGSASKMRAINPFGRLIALSRRLPATAVGAATLIYMSTR